MADMDGFLRALNLMAGDSNARPNQNQQQPVQQVQQVTRVVGQQFGGEEATCLIGTAAPNMVPATWVTETINGEQVSYDPLMFKRSFGGDRSPKALMYCGPTYGIVQQPIGLSDYAYMFSKANITRVNLERWIMDKVKTVEGMFSTCMSMSELRVDSWNVRKCRNMSRMLESCLSLAILKMSKWEPDNLEEIDDMFKAVDTALIPDWYEDWC